MGCLSTLRAHGPYAVRAFAGLLSPQLDKEKIMTTALALEVPPIGSTGKIDGEFVTVLRHDHDAVWFHYLHNGRSFAIYLRDWAIMSGRLSDFPPFGHFGDHLWD